MWIRKIVAASLFLLSSQSVGATTVIMVPREQLIARADAVVQGRVTSIRSVRSARSIDTFIELAVQRDFFRQIPDGTSIYVKQFGGRYGAEGAWAFGSAEFAEGEDVVVLLRLMPDGFFRVLDLFQGKFNVMPSGRLRPDSAPGARVLGAEVRRFENLSEIADATRDFPALPLGPYRRELDLPDSLPLREFSLQGISTSLEVRNQKADSGEKYFTLPSPAQFRWHQFDSSVLVPFLLNPTGSPLTSATTATAVTNALQAWNNIVTAKIFLSYGGTTAIAARNALDNTNVILFNDPDNEMDPIVGCVGTLATAFMRFGSPAQTVNSVSFFQLLDADIVFNDGAGCFLATDNHLDQVTAHEVGHGIGLDHSSENPSEPNPLLSDALMYFLAHNDNRGASVRLDDIGGASFIYPKSGVPAGVNFHTVTPCRVADTRNAAGPYGGPALSANTDRTFTVATQCGIPITARAISGNITVTQPTNIGDLRLYPGGTSLPLVSNINFRTGQTRANNIVIPLGNGGTLAVRCDMPAGTVHFILDVNGYFQ
ncbi:MAG TPA: matrixin family metalloprotease [Acidobacteriota bacterium]|jgi:hypothetical protein